MSRLHKSARLGQMESQGEVATIHKPFLSWLYKNKLLYVYHRPDKRSGIATGWPDFTICHCGRCLLIEAKKENGKLSEKQVECVANLRKNGNTVKIVYSASEAISAVYAWLGHPNADTEPLGRSGCPLGNERAAELIAGTTNLSGNRGDGTSEATRKSAVHTDCLAATTENNPALVQIQPAQNLWIADIRNALWVMSGDHKAGGLAKMVRRATITDIQTLPRQ